MSVMMDPPFHDESSQKYKIYILSAVSMRVRTRLLTSKNSQGWIIAEPIHGRTKFVFLLGVNNLISSVLKEMDIFWLEKFGFEALCM